MSDDSRPVTMGARGFGRLEWPLYTSHIQRDFYNRITSRGFTEEEIRSLKQSGKWKNGAWVTEAQHDRANSAG